MRVHAFDAMSASIDPQVARDRLPRPMASLTSRLRRPRLVRVLFAAALLSLFGLLATQPLQVPFTS